MEQAPTITEVVSNIAKLVAQVAIISTVVSLGVTEFAKKFIKRSSLIAIFAVAFGFVAGLFVMKIFGQPYFSPLSLLVAAIASLGAPGFYSVTTAIATKRQGSQE